MTRRFGQTTLLTVFFAFVAAILILSAAAIGGCGGTADNGGKTGPEVKVHHLYIKPSGTYCKVLDVGENRIVRVEPGEFVEWHNELEKNVILTFPDEKPLFGVLKAIVYAKGDPLRLQVRRDAVVDPHEHIYEGDCGTEMPGPVIIVNPPN